MKSTQIYFRFFFSLEMKKICTTNELIGIWMVKFVGTEYSNMSFEILNQTSSWDDRVFEPVC